MRSIRSATLVVFVAMLALSFGGCRKPATQPAPAPNALNLPPAPVSQPPSSPAAVESSPAVEVEPVTTPSTGGELRQALMDAARVKLGTSSKFTVHQLYAQGDTAIGDIETVNGGKRYFVAWTGPEWTAIWHTTFGSPTASAVGAKAALPDSFTTGLIGKIDWKLAKPVTSAPLASALSKSAVQWSNQMMSGVGKPYKVEFAKVAKDVNGVWWGHAVVQPSDSAGNSYEAIEFWCVYKNGKWIGKVQDPEPPAPSTYFPASVLGTLGF